MPYISGDWSGIGRDIGAKIAGRPSARQAKEDEKAYQREQDKYRNRLAYGGYDPARVEAGAQEAAFMSDRDLTAFQQNMTAEATAPGNLVMQRDLQKPSSELKEYMEFKKHLADEKTPKASANARDYTIDAQKSILSTLNEKRRAGDVLSPEETQLEIDILNKQRGIAGIGDTPALPRYTPPKVAPREPGFWEGMFKKKPRTSKSKSGKPMIWDETVNKGAGGWVYEEQ